MIEVLFKLIVLTSIWCLALQISTSEGMVFYKFREYAETKRGRIWEAIVLCPWCCASFHSVFGMLGAFGLGIIEIEWQTLILWIFTIAGSSLTVGMTWQVHKYIEVKNKYYEHLEQTAYFDLKQKKQNYNKNKNVK